MKFQIPKGVFDILPYGTDEAWRLSHHWQYLEEVMRKVAYDYNFKEIRTPVFEHTELFQRGAGETSDVVSKEMYTFLDKGKRSLSLRPEGTASTVRAVLENNLFSHGKTQKLFYIEAMFRYERPQSGRYRQHHQFGVEYLGNPAPEADLETIDMLCELYRRLGLKNVFVSLNSVGDIPSREKYKQALKEYLEPYLNGMSDDSKERFHKNPLRILDSKATEDKAALERAPSILDFLEEAPKKHFDRLCKLLDQIKLPYNINDKLVRGFDYYTGTVFEVVSGELGAQNAVGGGGRYDNLIKDFGGPSTPGIGWGTGLERILQVMLQQGAHFPENKGPFVYFIPLQEKAKEVFLDLAVELRHLCIPIEIELGTLKIQNALKNALKANAQYCAIMGDEELKNNRVQFKNLLDREQKELSFDELKGTITNLFENLR